MTATYPDFPTYLLRRDSWQEGFKWLCGVTMSGAAKRDAIRAHVKRAIQLAGVDGFKGAANAIVDWSFDRGHGDIGICWMMIASDPARPSTYHRFMPALARLVGDFQPARARLVGRGGRQVC